MLCSHASTLSRSLPFASSRWVSSSCEREGIGVRDVGKGRGRREGRARGQGGRAGRPGGAATRLQLSDRRVCRLLLALLLGDALPLLLSKPTLALAPPRQRLPRQRLRVRALPSLGTDRHPPVGRAAAAAGGYPAPTVVEEEGRAFLLVQRSLPRLARLPPLRLFLLVHRIEPLQYHRLHTLDPVADQVLVVVRLRLQEWGRRGERCGCGIGCGA